MHLPPEHINELTRILATRAITVPANVGVAGYFGGLIKQADLPTAYKLERTGGWSGDARFDARELLNWALAKWINPADRRFTTLGSVLAPELETLGFDDASTVAALIVADRLYQDPALLAEIAVRYQVPQPPSYATPGIKEVGPAFTWRGPSEEVELQSWLRPEPDFLDVAFLKRAIQRSSSVCRVEVGRTGKHGSGVLIDSDLVLTNYHVLSMTTDAELVENAPTTVFRFGLFTGQSGNPEEGQQVAVAAEKPIVVSSPIKELDFVLLRAGSAIAGATDVAAAPFTTARPALRSGLHILHHPGSDTMKLSVSANGVTGILTEQGCVQYVTTARAGSSGAPCFNDEWKLIALHHAERALLFGAVREGILMGAIYEKIKGSLAARPS